jgi:hypothetical protein
MIGYRVAKRLIEESEYSGGISVNHSKPPRRSMEIKKSKKRQPSPEEPVDRDKKEK